MASTIQSAKNSFSLGLVMDLSPDNTGANVMTSALNATLITMNGNERLLLNDMGNARVESAYLPDGYIPVGTCEFGDIIYVASYNPLTNKSLIGCFPSPERNVTSEEQSTAETVISASDFQEFNGDEPNGILNTTSIRKVLLGNKTMNPGDKYIIYSSKLSYLTDNEKYLSDYGLASHIYGKLPRYVRVHIVSLEDSGKVVYLDSTVKWYDDINYYLNKGNVDTSINKIDLDSYRSLTSSAYSIFQSKVSGKLALLIELEKITGFNCTYDIYSNKTDDGITHSVYWDFNWESDSKLINPKYIVLTKSEGLIDNPAAYPTDNYYYSEITSDYNPETWNAEDGIPKEPTINDYNISIEMNNNQPNVGNYNVGEVVDTIVNNYYQYPIYKKFKDFKFNKETLKSPVYSYEITPAMAYGLLSELAISGTIDFSKVGTGEINLTKWKYYNSGNVSMLTLGLDVYPEQNKGVDEVVIEFYDNSGLCAAYHISGRTSYSGTFTENIPLNGESNSIKLNGIDKSGNKFYHPGLNAGITETTEFSENSSTNMIYKVGGTWYPVVVNSDKLLCYETKITNEDNKTEYEYTQIDEDKYGDVYLNDSGTLYANLLYYAKIIVKYCPKDAYGELNTTNESEFKIFNRWYWTNSMFNSNYYYVNDFDSLKFELNLDCAANYSFTDYNRKLVDYKGSQESGHTYKNLAANVLYVYGTIKSKVEGGLYETYNTFNLSRNALNSILVTVYLPNDKAISNTTYQLSYTADNNCNTYESLNPISNVTYSLNDLGKLLGASLEISGCNSDIELYDSELAYKNYNNMFNLDLKNQKSGTDSLEYIDSNSEKKTTTSYNYLTYNLSNSNFNFDLNLLHFSKYLPYCSNVTKDVNCLVPIIGTLSDAENLGLKYSSDRNRFEFPYMYCLQLYSDNDSDGLYLRMHKFEYNNSYTLTTECETDYGYSAHKQENVIGKHQLRSQYDNAWKAYRDLYKLSMTTGFSIVGMGWNWKGVNNYTYGISLTNDATISSRRPYGRCGDYWNGFNNSYSYQTDKFAYNGTYPILQYLFISSDYEHHLLLNCFITSGNIPVSGSKYTVPNGICAGSYTLNTIGLLKIGVHYKKTFADILLEPFTLIYVKSQSETTTVISQMGILYLTNNYTSYLEDLVYKIETINTVSNNDLIQMSGLEYNTYLKTLKKYIIGDYNENNVTLTLNSATKTIPFQINVDYIMPDFSNVNDSSINTVIKTITGNKYYISTGNISDDLMYLYIDSLLSILNSTFKYLLLSSLKVDESENIIATLSGTYYNGSGIYKTFTYNSGLNLKYTDKVGSSSLYYSILGLGLKGDNGSLYGIKDLNRQDKIIDEYVFV